MNKNTASFCSCLGCHTRILSIFKHLSQEELEKIDALKKCHIFKKGEYLYKEDSYPNGLYCINAGKVKLVNTNYLGKEHILKIVGKGDVTGENAIFSKQPHCNSAIVLEDTVTCFIPQEVFISLLRNSPLLTMDVMQSLANNLEASQQKQTSLAQKTVKERLANALIQFKETYGENLEHFINIKFSREEMADFIGTSTETVIRLLSEWNQLSIIHLYKKMIRIDNLPALRLLAEA